MDQSLFPEAGAVRAAAPRLEDLLQPRRSRPEPDPTQGPQMNLFYPHQRTLFEVDPGAWDEGRALAEAQAEQDWLDMMAARQDEEAHELERRAVEALA